MAQHSERYARQELIRRYEHGAGVRLVVMIDTIFNASVTLLDEMLIGSDPD